MRGRVAVEIAGVALYGLLHAAAAGAVVLVGLRLAVPGVLDVGSPAEAWAGSLAFGLACLRVPLEAGGLDGTFAPLGGLILTGWGIASAVGRRSPDWIAARRVTVAGVAIAFSLVCLGAAAAAGTGDLRPSLPGAALAGAAWGGAAAAWGTSPFGPGGAGRERRRLRATLASWLGAGPREGLDAGAAAGDRQASRFGPGWAGVVAAAAVAALWFVPFLAVRLADASGSAALGGLLLAGAAAPNALGALVALGMGASVEVVFGGTALAESTRDSFALWGWSGSGLAPPLVLGLVLAPLAGVLVAGRVAAAAAPGDPVFRRGLRNGLVLAAAVGGVAWAGALRASAGAGAEEVSLRLDVPAVEAAALALAWSLAGAYAGARLPWPRGAAPDAGAAPEARRPSEPL